MSRELWLLAERVEKLCTEWGDGDARDERDAIAAELRQESMRLSHPQAASSTQAADIDDVLSVLDGWGLVLRDRVGKKPALTIADVAALIRRLASSTTPASGEAIAKVIPNVVGVEIAWINPPSCGRPPVGTLLYTAPPATRAPVVDDAMVESFRADICALDAWFRGEGPGYTESESDALLDRLRTAHAALTAAQEGAQGERGASA